MAVDSTPERSLSDLLSSSRAVEATTGCAPLAEMRCSSSSPSAWPRSDDADRTGSSPHRPGSCRAPRRGRVGSCRPEANGWFSPNASGARGRLRDRPACRRRSGRRALPSRRGEPRAADCRRMTSDWSDRTGARGRTSARKPAVSRQFSPLMSWTIAAPGQVKSDGITRPTPLPDLVGAKHSTCSGPSWRR